MERRNIFQSIAISPATMKMYRAIRFVNLLTITFCAAVFSINGGGGGVDAMALSNTDYMPDEPEPFPGTGLSLTGGIAVYGCIKDDPSNRVLRDSNSSAPDMSVNKCDTACSQFTYFGLEYGDTCYCGNQPNIAANTAYTEREQSCNTKCIGGGSENCGGNGFVDVYKRVDNEMHEANKE